MSLELCSTRLLQYFRVHGSRLLFDLTSFAITVYLFLQVTASLGAMVASLCFGLLLWIANHWQGRLSETYALAALSFVSFLTAVFVSGLEFAQMTPVAFYIALLYTYLLPDLFSGVFVGVVVSLLFYTNSESAPPAAQTVGLVASAFSYSAVSFLLRRLIAEREKFRKMSITDSLTGLANLAYTMQTGQQMMERGTPLTVMVIDLDHFKQVNDTYGHLIGNKILIQVTRLLRQETAGMSSIVGRLGGDEFIILLENCSQEKVQELRTRLHQNLQGELFQADPDLIPIKLSFSIGVANSKDQPGSRLEDLMNAADLNMYYHKHNKSKSIINPQLGLSLLSEQGHRLLHVLAEKDMYTYVHSQYVVQYTMRLAEALGLSERMIEDLCIAGWLHDLGKVLTPSHILRKSMCLTDDEYGIIKQHVLEGLHILDGLGLSTTVHNAIRYHHERFDGTGYPFRISGENTPLEGRILQITDAFSAMTIKRVYRERLSFEDAIAEIKRHSGSQFDPHLVEVFLSLFDEKGEPFNKEVSRQTT